MKFIFLVLLSLNNIFCLLAQKGNAVIYPEVGKPCPDFILRNIQYYSKKKATLKDFQGKWLLLDFWSKNCGACVAGFPRVNEIQKLLGNNVQVIMVGPEDAKKQTELIYSRYRIKEKLLMPCAFDTLLFQRFNYGSGLPRSVLIDDKGIVQCLTSSIHLDEMQAFLLGQHPVIARSYRDDEHVPEIANHLIPFDDDKPFPINGNGGVDTDFIFRSILTAWKPGINKETDNENLDIALQRHPKGFTVLGTDLKTLYYYAYLGRPFPDDDYYGKYYPELSLEVHDSSLFKVDDKTDKNRFCYAVNLPHANVERMEKMMQRDLENYFGFVVTIENRECPCWILTSTAKAKERLKTKGEAPLEVELGRVNYSIRNMPFQNIIDVIKAQSGGIVYDESGITGNVDIALDCKDCIMSDIHDLIKMLQENGLVLATSQRKMKVLVVHDALSTSIEDKVHN